jgi:asparagine synthase (glutamine-hydrolysing)
MASVPKGGAGVCGLTGFLGFGPRTGLGHLARGMVDAIRHRGPDDVGTWVDESISVALGHRRLSIVDLSPAGHQPMHSASGRSVLAFNGEIYNHLSLRRELEALHAAPIWRGHSDTETLLAALEFWGLEAALERCVGMFAFSLWDRQERTLTLVRDRFGEKPLYFGWVGRGEARAFVFGSELKALRAYPGFDAPISREALSQYLCFNYVPAPRSIYEGIFKLEPGCLLKVQGLPPRDPPSEPIRPGQAHGNVVVKRWWSLSEVVQAGARNPLISEAEAVELLEHQLSESIRLQSLADVPLGAFLSGGVDSSVIVALMQRQSSIPVKTFTVGFEETEFDESPYARAVARHLGTEHYEMRATPQMARDLIPRLPPFYDEPFADSSQIPTLLVCGAARQYVTVALSGDAGDELFGGYNRYFWGPGIWSRLSGLPMPMRKVLGYALSTLPSSAWDRFGRALAFAGSADGVQHLGDKVHKLGARLRTVRDIDGLYRSLVSEWEGTKGLVLNSDRQLGAVTQPLCLLDDPLPARGTDADQLRMMYLDAISYLPDDILCKVDRAAMACSLETRVPFLDHRVVELAWRLPLSMKIRGRTGKWALREVLYKHVPRELVERPKSGFAVPVGQWLRGPLRSWAEDLLAEHTLRDQGYLDSGPIRQRWAEHLSGVRDYTSSLWGVLMFQAWLADQRGSLVTEESH